VRPESLVTGHLDTDSFSSKPVMVSGFQIVTAYFSLSLPDLKPLKLNPSGGNVAKLFFTNLAI
jgi:hypothetical protein